MRAVIQRVSNGSVTVLDKKIGEINHGLVILLGVDVNDNEEDISWLANKIVNLRIFGDEKKLMNNSLIDVNGDLMIISQFTLFAGGFTTVDYGTSNNYLALLFASLDGISKVGSYTGNGADNRTIDCGFTNGARFVIIKRTDQQAKWFVFDSQRGIVSGNDPYFALDNSDAQVTSADYVEPANAGFAVNSHSDFNANGGNYIFYAVA